MMNRSKLLMKAFFSNSLRNDRLIVNQQQLKKDFKAGDTT